MAQLTNIYDSVDAANVDKESLDNVIHALNPAKTPFMSNAARGKAIATLHEWTYDTFVAASTSNAQVEGDQYSNTAITAPTRGNNYTQISNKVIEVSGTQQAVATVGSRDTLAYNLVKYGQLLKNDMEAILCGNQAASAGTNNSVSLTRTLRSFEAWVPEANRDDNVTNGAGTTTQAATDGTTGQLRAFTENQFLTVLQAMFTAGADPNLVLYHPNKATVLGSFSGAAFRQIGSDMKKAVNMIEFYETDFGTVKCQVSRYVRPNDATPGRSVLIMDTEMVEVAYLRPFESVPLAKTGDSDRTAIQAEYTFVARNPSALGVVADLSTAS